MAVRITKLGPGTLVLGDPDGDDFAAEFTGVTITHEYEETQESITMLSGDVLPAAEKRSDGISGDCMNDLSAAGLYAFCQTNDMQPVPIVYTPNTAGGTSWTGTVVVKLPDEIGTDTFGNPLASSIEWSAVGPLVFAPESD